MADAAVAIDAGGKAGPLLRVAGLAKHFDVSKPFLNRVFEGEKRRGRTERPPDVSAQADASPSRFEQVSGERGRGRLPVRSGHRD